MKKKILSAICAALLILGMMVSLVACGTSETDTGFDATELRILSWQEYIDEGDVGVAGTVELFEEYWLETYGREITVIYDVVESNEEMYRKIAVDGESYDLVCPSDYMIEKMIKENLLRPLDFDNIPNAGNISPYISNGSTGLMDQFTDRLPSGKTMAQYAVPYMWGTLGILYDADKVAEVTSWDALWNAPANTAFMKDIVRDSYFAAAYRVKNTNEDLADRSPNDTSSEMIAAIKDVLNDIKPRLKGWEVDEAKSLLVDGTTNATMCLQWAGDAAWAIEDSSRNLAYAIPEEGSNVFFDAYVVPKTSVNKTAAEVFMNFLCDEEIAYNNMSYIGYTSCVATEGMFELLTAEGDWDGDDLVDVSYFFGDIDGADGAPLNWIQYPSIETLANCEVMYDFGNRLSAVNTMWWSVRGNS